MAVGVKSNHQSPERHQDSMRPYSRDHASFAARGVSRSNRGRSLAPRERARSEGPGERWRPHPAESLAGAPTGAGPSRSARDVLAVGGGIEPPTIQNAEIRKPASARHSLALTGSLRAPVCATGSVMSCGIISSRRMALGGGIEPPTMQSHEITKPASVRHSLAVLGSRQCPSVAKVWQTG